MFAIYGRADAALRTKACIRDWLTANKPSKNQLGTSHFVKQASLTETLRFQIEREWDYQVRRFMFRKHPVPGTEFDAIGSFLWPSKDDSISIDALGPSFEALDKIRMDESCYVVWDAKQSLFKVFGNAKNVQKSLIRLRMVCFQIVARHMPGCRMFLLDLTDTHSIPTHIRLVPYEHPAILAPPGARQPTPSLTPVSEGSSTCTCSGIQDSTDETSSRNVDLIKACLLQVLPKLHYFCGYLQLRLRLGTFLNTQFKRAPENCYTLGDYGDMMRQSQFAGYVTPHIGDRMIESRLLSTIKEAGHILLPEDHRIDKLEDVQPTYAATFTFQERSSYLRLMVEWRKAVEPGRETDTMERILTKWIKFNKEDDALLDVSLVNVQGGLAWQFDLIGAQSIDEANLPRELIEFSQKLDVIPDVAHTANTYALFVQFPHTSLLQSLQQRIVYRYDLKPIVTGYTLEVSRLQDHVVPQTSHGSAFVGKSPSIIYEARWAVSLYRNDWDSMFSSNESLPVGARANWPDDFGIWFPDEGQKRGFHVLMGKLRVVQSLTEHATEDLLTGMSIG
ncbi:hypothetical protein K431DRAFT_232831 [Polychaeton citri CBS 116435]|uniref:DUF7905 domain-containing protein n=1 Tax=Polychaeton citri CBS 116435 TaxID=1314669 RepID=A0A9P4PYZ9_9PEZI|nr:hypothetical protein K431DRAFT_232831 [Polychaeton citri CBS 116435]